LQSWFKKQKKNRGAAEPDIKDVSAAAAASVPDLDASAMDGQLFGTVSLGVAGTCRACIGAVPVAAN